MEGFIMDKFSESHTLAVFLSKNMDKENIIPEIFRIFNIDCLEKCNMNPTDFDNLISRFIESDDCNTSYLEDIITFIKSNQENAKSKENEIIKKIIEYIDNTYTEEISIEEIANSLHISYYYMCHIFKEKYKISIGTYRTRKRLEKAMRLLIESDKQISDIAVLSGYNSISYFTEAFNKHIGISPTEFKKQNTGKCFHEFYGFDDILQASKLDCTHFIDKNIKTISPAIETVSVHMPDENFKFLHEAAIIEYHGVLFTSWYMCEEQELSGRTPICGKRSYDGGKTWSELEFICDDEDGKIIYCPPVYGICDDKLYMFVNQMIAHDCIHAFDLYVLNEKTDKFELLWSKPLPFKVNTNVVTLPNGKLMLTGRVGKLDGLPKTPAVLISDSGKIDTEWRLVKLAENKFLPDGSEHDCPETSVICAEDVLYMFCRNDKKVPLVYISKDYGESWSTVNSTDIPFVTSKAYCGSLKSGQHFMICNTDKFCRSRLTAYFTDNDKLKFTKKIKLFDSDDTYWGVIHYPSVCEYNGILYIIVTKGYENGKTRGALLFKINLNEI